MPSGVCNRKPVAPAGPPQRRVYLRDAQGQPIRSHAWAEPLYRPTPLPDTITEEDRTYHHEPYLAGEDPERKRHAVYGNYRRSHE